AGTTPGAVTMYSGIAVATGRCASSRWRPCSYISRVSGSAMPASCRKAWVERRVAGSFRRPGKPPRQGGRARRIAAGSEPVAQAEHVARAGLGGIAHHVRVAGVDALGLVCQVDALQAQHQVVGHRITDDRIQLAVLLGPVRIRALAADAVEELVAPVVRRAH